MTYEELIYRITGNIVKHPVKLDTNAGTTYNFLESLPAHPLALEVGKNAPVVTYAEGFAKVLDMMTDDKALSAIVVEDIYDLIKMVFNDNIPFDINEIKNRELKVRLFADTLQPINSDIIYNVLFYMLTNRTTYIRTFREFRRQTDNSMHTRIPDFIRYHEITLSKYFRRNRSLLMFIKHQFNGELNSLINKISRQSRKTNVPTSNKTFAQMPLSEKPTAELCKMLYASDVITVRNGLKYKVADRNKEPYPREEILEILRTRDDVFTDEQKALIKAGWHLAIPSSMKMAAGIIPNGSYISIKTNDEIGLQWSDDINAYSHVDLDLSFNAISPTQQKYGWNGEKRGIVTYSGDMTYMKSDANGKTQSAYESFTVKDPTCVGILDVSAYSFGTASSKVSLIVNDELYPINKPTSTSMLGIIVDKKFIVNIDESINASSSNISNLTVSDGSTFNNSLLTNAYYL